jgi:anthranilate synthase component 2
MTGKLVVFDNYDSFTYNLVHYLEALTGYLPEVILNDAPNWEEALHAEALLISPGPGLPEESGFLMELLRAWNPKKPLLGICLGMQAMGQLEGEPLEPLPQPAHGVSHAVHCLKTDPLFLEIDRVFQAGRYHSWGFYTLVSGKYLPLAKTNEGCIMAMKHLENPWYGLQFHPESIMTPVGMHILHNWLNIAGIPHSYLPA